MYMAGARHPAIEPRRLQHLLDCDQRLATIGRRIRTFEALDQVIPQHERVGHRLERERARGTGDERLIRRRAERHDQLIVRHLVGDAFRGDRVDNAPFDIDGLYVCFDEARAAQCGPDGLCAVAQLERSRARFEEEWREHEEGVTTHECDLDASLFAAETLQVARRSDSAKPAAEDDDLPSRFRREESIVPSAGRRALLTLGRRIGCLHHHLTAR